MKKYIVLSVLASTMLMAAGETKALAAAEEADADYGEVFGQFRTFYVDRTYFYSNKPDNNRNTLATGGYIGYKTPDFNGLTAAVAAYGTYGFNMHDVDIDNDLTSSYYDPSLIGRDGESYLFIGEAYLNYAFGNTNIKVGRQRLDTPLAGADDARMLPNLFEAAVVSNTDIEDTTLILAHITKETTGTFSNIYDDGYGLGFASGYGAGTTFAQSGDFVNMGTVALGYNDFNGDGSTDNKTDGVTAAAAIYKGIDGLTLQAWDYYAHDILNAVYLQADYGWKCLLNENVTMNASAQYIGQSDVGDALAGKVDSDYWAVKLGASLGALSAYVAYSQTGESDGATGGGIISPWGGMPAFTQGMVTRHQFFSDTDSWKVAGTYKLNELLDADVKASLFYTEFDVGATNSYAEGTAWTATESGFDIEYQATKALNLRFRGNFPNKFHPTASWDEYRLIANYNF
ncbi:MAG TPA: OprD family outer membrane porin [Sulfurovum sp.]|uniref:OprD family outer membrane porin n=1 Tax=Sulfurovum sp. TaxID=1969726 RepID=UPI002F949C9B